MAWKDQGWGYQKGKVALFADGVEVYTVPRAPHSRTVFESSTIELAAGVMDLKFKYVVGSDGGHSITIDTFAWSWSPSGAVAEWQGERCDVEALTPSP